MKNLLLGMVFVSSLSVCPAQIIKTDFTASSMGVYSVYSGIYNQSNTPANPWSFSWPYSGTFTYDTDSLQETFINNDPYWKWQYQSPQVSLSINKSGGGTYDNSLSFPYGSVTTYTEYALVTGTDLNGQIVTKPLYSEYFEVVFDDKSSHSGIVNSIILRFKYIDYIDHTGPYQPQTVFDPDHYIFVVSNHSTFPPTFRITYHGLFIVQTASYSETGERLGYYQRVSSDMDSLQATVIPEPATLLLLAVGGLLIRKRSFDSWILR